MAIRRSHHSASSSPPARHQPEIAAIVGFGEVTRREAERPARVVQPRREGLDRLQVGSRAERHAARAGHDEHARVVVGLEAVVAVGQQLGGGAVDRVAPLLAVDREDEPRRRAARRSRGPCGHFLRRVHIAAGARAASIGGAETPLLARRGPGDPGVAAVSAGRYQPTRLRRCAALRCSLRWSEDRLERTSRGSRPTRRRSRCRARRT